MRLAEVIEIPLGRREEEQPFTEHMHAPYIIISQVENRYGTT
jgi:hypothetical protein